MLATDLKTFVKKHDFLVCIDSDGTAMDVMNMKHKRCFGPCLVREWELQEYEKEVLELWNRINLYSMTRGANRFLTLYYALCEINEKYKPIADLDALKAWTDETQQLSNGALKEAADASGKDILRKALRWSQSVNAETVLLTYDDKRPFDGVKQFLSEAYCYADIAIVSSAGYAVIREEWEYHGLLDYVSVIAAQEDGSKKECLLRLAEKGYKKENILMIGDAPGDMKAAHESGTLFYPMEIDRESKSWKALKNTYFKEFLTCNYLPSQNKLEQSFCSHFEE